jgi:hypothetical protein
VEQKLMKRVPTLNLENNKHGLLYQNKKKDENKGFNDQELKSIVKNRSNFEVSNTRKNLAEKLKNKKTTKLSINEKEKPVDIYRVKKPIKTFK